jgi:hypothetical protein
MNQKYDLLKAIGRHARVNAPSPLSTDLQVCCFRLAMQEMERAHYRGIRGELLREA